MTNAPEETTVFDPIGIRTRINETGFDFGSGDGVDGAHFVINGMAVSGKPHDPYPDERCEKLVDVGTAYERAEQHPKQEVLGLFAALKDALIRRLNLEPNPDELDVHDTASPAQKSAQTDIDLAQRQVFDFKKQAEMTKAPTMKAYLLAKAFTAVRRLATALGAKQNMPLKTFVKKPVVASTMNSASMRRVNIATLRREIAEKFVPDDSPRPRKLVLEITHSGGGDD